MGTWTKVGLGFVGGMAMVIAALYVQSIFTQYDDQLADIEERGRRIELGLEQLLVERQSKNRQLVRENPLRASHEHGEVPVDKAATALANEVLAKDINNLFTSQQDSSAKGVTNLMSFINGMNDDLDEEILNKRR